MTTTDEITTVPTTSANGQTLLEMAIAEQMQAIHEQEALQKQRLKDQEAEGHKRQQNWLKSQLPGDVCQTLGITLDPKRGPHESAHATFTFDDKLWHLYQYRGDLLQIVPPDGQTTYTYRNDDGLRELLGALGWWREREAKRQVEVQTTAEQETPAPEAPRIVTNGEVFCAVLSEELATYSDALTLVSAFLRPNQITFHRSSTVVTYDDDGRPVPYGKEFSLTDHELDLLIQARETYRQHLREEAERRAADGDDVPF